MVAHIALPSMQATHHDDVTADEQFDHMAPL
jgi:hypothetical protein